MLEAQWAMGAEEREALRKELGTLVEFKVIAVGRGQILENPAERRGTFL